MQYQQTLFVPALGDQRLLVLVKQQTEAGCADRYKAQDCGQSLTYPHG
jgi:hypothetical protein